MSTITIEGNRNDTPERGARVSIAGLEHGKATLLAISDSTVAISFAGGTYWSGIGMPRGYAPAHVDVYRIDESLGFGHEVFNPIEGPQYRVTKLITWTVRAS